MNVFYSDSKTDLKLQCDCCIKIPAWLLHVACYYPTTPTDYLSTIKGMSVGPSVAVNIEFCGYLWFLSISFAWIILVQYATNNLSGQQLQFAS